MASKVEMETFDKPKPYMGGLNKGTALSVFVMRVKQ